VFPVKISDERCEVNSAVARRPSSPRQAPRSAVFSAVLGLNKLSALEPAEPVRHYEREHPGQLIHLDIKKLGRIGSPRRPNPSAFDSS
jgi:hypothetical protein